MAPTSLNWVDTNLKGVAKPLFQLHIIGSALEYECRSFGKNIKNTSLEDAKETFINPIKIFRN